MTTVSKGRKAASMHQATQHAPRGRGRGGRVTGSKHGTTADPRSEFSDEEWRDMVATAAYYRAQARGLDSGSAEEDWYEAEAEMRERFAAADSQVETAASSDDGATNIETKGE